jgi:site-specific DNA-methyltransferase (adenine-specific)
VTGSLPPKVAARLQADGVALLPPLDAGDVLEGLRQAGVRAACCMLDPWYNKGVGGTRPDYDDYIGGLLRQAAAVADHVYLWGFPEIVARFVDRLPAGLELTAWLTWFYKNNPSVIRGWRSAQMACLHLSAPGARLHPEHFLNEAQRDKQRQGKLRYIPGPTTVIEEPLLVGFVGRREQTGHPAQKPEAVFDKLVRMATVEGDLVIDPLCGSGTTGAVARATNRLALLSDHEESYVRLVESRLELRRIAPNGLVGAHQIRRTMRG